MNIKGKKIELERVEPDDILRFFREHPESESAKEYVAQVGSSCMPVDQHPAPATEDLVLAYIDPEDMELFAEWHGFSFVDPDNRRYHKVAKELKS